MVAKKTQQKEVAGAFIITIVLAVVLILWLVTKLRHNSRPASTAAQGQSACSLLSVDEAGQILGQKMKESGANPSRPSAVSTCDYRTESDTGQLVVALTVERDIDADTAQRAYREALEHDGETEVMPDLGNEAYYAGGIEHLRVRQGNVLLTVRAGEPGNEQDKAWALKVAQTVVGRL